MGLTWADYQAKERRYKAYFPEYLLASYLKTSVWAFEDAGGVVAYTNAYKALLNHLKPDALVLCDGGYDSLMFGHEEGLGTPHEDMMTLAAVDEALKEFPIPGFLTCLGARVELGIDDGDFFRNWATLVKNGGFIGLEFLDIKQPWVQAYRDAFLACDPPVFDYQFTSLGSNGRRVWGFSFTSCQGKDRGLHPKD